MKKGSTYLSGTVWTEEEADFVRNFYVQLSHSEMALRLNRGIGSIKGFIRKQGLKLTDEQKLWKKQSAAYKMHEHENCIDKLYTEDELKLLIELYPNTHNKVIAERMGRNINGFVKKAMELGLKKSDEYMSNMFKVQIPSTDGHKNFVRPSQSLSAGYILVNILGFENTAINRASYAMLIRETRERIIKKRIENGKIKRVSIGN